MKTQGNKKQTFAYTFGSLILFAACAEKPLIPAKQSEALPKIFEAQAKTQTYPGQEWSSTPPEKAGINREKLKNLENYLFPQNKSAEGRTGIRTDAFVLIKKGNLVFEKYSNAFHKNRKHLAWSVTKSVANACVGIAVLDKKVAVADSASKYYAPLAKDGKEVITIDHLLRMSSGLYWSEGYESSPLHSSVIAMLYTRGRNDMGAFAAEQKLKHTPGTHWYYSSGTTNIIMALLANAYASEQTKGSAAMESLIFTRLFKQLGMRYTTFERDRTGTFIGSSYLYTTARDMARFGYLYLHDGLWQGRRILPEGWVRYTTTMAPAYYTTQLAEEDHEDNPGAQWYINQGVPERGQKPPWPDAPPDTFAALGHWGQSIFVIPSLDMVAVRFGDDRDKTFQKNQYLKLLVNSLDKTP